jgi:hypothetical protein
MAGADLFQGKSTAVWLLVVGLFRENITAVRWLISQTNRVLDSPLHPTASSNQQQLVLLHTEYFFI